MTHFNCNVRGGPQQPHTIHSSPFTLSVRVFSFSHSRPHSRPRGRVYACFPMLKFLTDWCWSIAEPSNWHDQLTLTATCAEIRISVLIIATDRSRTEMLLFEESTLCFYAILCFECVWDYSQFSLDSFSVETYIQYIFCSIHKSRYYRQKSDDDNWSDESDAQTDALNESYAQTNILYGESDAQNPLQWVVVFKGGKNVRNDTLNPRSLPLSPYFRGVMPIWLKCASRAQGSHKGAAHEHTTES